MKRILILIGVILGIVGFDQLTKMLVLQNLPTEGSSFAWIENVVHFTYVQNKGAFFGILSDQRWVFMLFSSLAIVGLSVYLFRFCKQNWVYRISIAFLIGGGIGNMIDRIAYGFVVDFVELPWLWLPVLNRHFPVFNIADSFITIGIAVLLVMLVRDVIVDARKKKTQTEPEPTADAVPPSSGEQDEKKHE